MRIAETMKVKFLRDYTVQDCDGCEYTEGQVVDLPDASAQHFINRGIAEKCDDESCPPDPKPKAKARRATKDDA